MLISCVADRGKAGSCKRTLILNHLKSSTSKDATSSSWPYY